MGTGNRKVVAIGHTAIGRDLSCRKLYRLGVETLIERKHPEKQIVYGASLDFCPDTEVVYIEGKIQQLRNRPRMHIFAKWDTGQ